MKLAHRSTDVLGSTSSTELSRLQLQLYGVRRVGPDMKKWSTLRSEMSQESRARMDAQLKETLAAMPLDKMRKARSLTQTAVAERLHVDQGSVSKLEGRTDMYLSTLREYVEALGGTLELRADFPDGSINIDLHAAQ